MPDIIAGASCGTARRIAWCSVVIVSRRSAGRAARNSARVGSDRGMRQGCAPGPQVANVEQPPADAASGGSARFQIRAGVHPAPRLLPDNRPAPPARPRLVWTPNPWRPHGDWLPRVRGPGASHSRCARPFSARVALAPSNPGGALIPGVTSPLAICSDSSNQLPLADECRQVCDLPSNTPGANGRVTDPPYTDPSWIGGVSARPLREPH